MSPSLSLSQDGWHQEHISHTCFADYRSSKAVRILVTIKPGSHIKPEILTAPPRQCPPIESLAYHPIYSVFGPQALVFHFGHGCSYSMEKERHCVVMYYQ
jgi:hypothetical protein